MEIGLVECTDESHLAMEVPSTFQQLIFCLPRGKLAAPRGCEPLRTFELSGHSPERSYLFFAGDFEMGFILGRLASHRITLFTHRNDLDSYQTIKVKVSRLSWPPPSPTPIGPSPSSLWQDELSAQFLHQLEEKYRVGFLVNPLTRASKKASVLAQMRNIADGICASHKAKYPHLSESVPGSEEISERLYEDLKRRGLISERLGQVEYFVQGAPVAAKVPVSLPSMKKLASNLKLDTLHKYMEKFLMQPSVRAVKEKSARAQLTNLAKGSVIATKTKYGPNVDIPTEEKMSGDIFDRLVELGAVSVDGLSVTYSDERIAEIVGDSRMQELICEESDVREKARVQIDMKITILKEALVKYYQKFLLNVATAAKTTKGVKEQIKNFVQGSVTSAAKSNPDLLRVLPSVDDLTENLYRMMITRRVIITVGSTIRYSTEAIQALDSQMQDSGIWEEAASPEGEGTFAVQIVPKVLQQLSDMKRMTVSDLYELAKKSTHLSIAFGGAGKSTAAMLVIAKEVVHTILASGEEARLAAASPSLEEVMEDITRFGRLEVIIGRGGSDSEEADA